MRATPEVELKALELFEQLNENPFDDNLRRSLLHDMPQTVISRLRALEEGHASRGSLPTDLPLGAHQSLVAPPDQVGPYQLVECIGAGGMGSVWRAHRVDGLFTKNVAIKFMNVSLDQRAGEAFANERRILASLEHFNIVKLIDGGIASSGAPYLIMDLVDGQPIDQAWLSLDLKARIGLLIEVARTVQFAHGRFVAHGDLKPANILVDDHQRPRLLDFGISRLVNAENDPGFVRGAMTLEFASPQRLAGAQPSIADDIHALGVLTRRACGSAADRDLAAIVAKASAPEEPMRYATASDLARDLERWLQRKPVSARPDRWTYRSGLFLKRNLLWRWRRARRRPACWLSLFLRC